MSIVCVLNVSQYCIYLLAFWASFMHPLLSRYQKQIDAFVLISTLIKGLEGTLIPQCTPPLIYIEYGQNAHPPNHPPPPTQTEVTFNFKLFPCINIFICTVID
jgi:hypothetical protein